MKPQLGFEEKRLGSSENDWNLVAASASLSRTRGGGNGRPNLDAFRERMCISEVGPEDASDVGESITTSGSSATTTGTSVASSDSSARRRLKPSHSRVILEVDHIEKVFEKLGCPKCGGPIKASVQTVCISPSIGFECMDKACSFSHEAEKPSSTSIHADSNANSKSTSHERSTDYAINVLYVLGFISVGDGCTEAARVLGVLGLPNDTTMESRSFTIIEDRLVPLL
jgi:hypothetical protein